MWCQKADRDVAWKEGWVWCGGYNGTQRSLQGLTAVLIILAVATLSQVYMCMLKRQLVHFQHMQLIVG